MTIAADIDEAIGLAGFNIGAVSDAVNQSLLDQFDIWQAQAFAPFASSSSAKTRTVGNWLSATALVRVAIAEQGAGFLDTDSYAAGQATEVVTRALWAAKTARALNYITVAQRDAVLAAYNAAWG